MSLRLILLITTLCHIKIAANSPKTIRNHAELKAIIKMTSILFYVTIYYIRRIMAEIKENAIMNYLTVDIYHDFECVASACPNTCCAGWDITIDTETCKKMKEKEELLGMPAQDWLEDKDGTVTAKLKHNRCCMLNENNLCQVVLKLGPEYLSDTCRQYPRIIKQYGDIFEGSLTISCPEVLVRLMEKKCVQFDFSEDNTHTPSYPHYNLYLYESKVRTCIIDILQNNPDIALTTKLFVSFQILDKAISLYQKNETSFDVLNQDIDHYSQRNYLLPLNAQLHNIVKETNRHRFLRQFLNVVPKSHDDHFNKLVIQTISYFDDSNMETYLTDLHLFHSFTRTYDTFYTNYWIYRIFSEMITIPDYEKAKDNLLCIAAEFCLFQTFALAAYARQKLDKEEYIYIISYIARMIKHNTHLSANLITRLRENDSISAAGLLTLILV